MILMNSFALQNVLLVQMSYCIHVSTSFFVSIRSVVHKCDVAGWCNGKT